MQIYGSANTETEAMMNEYFISDSRGVCGMCMHPQAIAIADLPPRNTSQDISTPDE